MERWYREEYDDRAKALKIGDKVRIRKDILEHKDEIKCFYIERHDDFVGKIVTVNHIIDRCLSEGRTCYFFKTEESDYIYFDTDMIDWGYDNNNSNNKSNLLSWVNEGR